MKLMDRSISPLPNLPSQSLKLSNKLTGSLRSQSPSQPGRPAKKKKKATIKEKSPASLHVASHDPVIQQKVIVGHHKMKSDRPKPPSSSYTTSQTSFSSSLSSSESDMEEVSMPTLSTMTTAAAAAVGDGNGMVGSLKRGKSSDSSSSASNSSSSESQSDDDSDEVILHHLHTGKMCVHAFQVENTRYPSPRRPSMSVLRKC